ncbi:WxL domain-containing protein [Vagococcus silagei]|uniref:WxL domain-containing protein n=1 Tax=Vagococcus silagei TaxID=2508885 RepID=A0A4S3B7A2_9ENTE|nr:WxL domain-containing protein [Vagococcus silagei]THB62337.1 WxL domain-containing protein [Vagococcus silagei]
MKRVMTSLTLCTVVLSGLALTAHAAPDTPDARQSKTEADITFEPGGGEVIVPTKDPNPDPNDPRTPDPDPHVYNPAEPGQKGPLRFTYVPNISFGKTALIAQTQNYYANYMNRPYTKEDGTKVEAGIYPTFFTVEDVRGGAKGWTVKVKNSGEFTNSSNEKINATLWFKKPNVRSGTFSDGSTSGDAQKPSYLTGLADGNYFNISTDSDVTLVQAKVGQGYGKWSVGYGSTKEEDKTTGYGLDGNVQIPAGTQNPTIDMAKKGKNSGIKLEVPAQVINTDGDKATYKSTLEWTISNEPGPA